MGTRAYESPERPLRPESVADMFKTHRYTSPMRTANGTLTWKGTGKKPLILSNSGSMGKMTWKLMDKDPHGPLAVVVR